MPSFLPAPIDPAHFEPATNILTNPTGDDTTNNIFQSTRSRIPTQRLQESVDMGLMRGFEAAIENDKYYNTLHRDD